MLDSEKIVVSVKNHKKETFDQVTNFVHFYVRHYEYEKVHARIEDILEKIGKAHAGTDGMKISDDDARKILSEIDKAENEKYTPEEIESFLVDREEVGKLKNEMDSWGVTWEEFKALDDTDKVFIELQAHTAIPAITLDDDLLGNLDLAKIVGDYYRNGDGSMKAIKDELRSMFSRIVGEEGELFYGIKLKKSNLNGELVRDFLAEFRGKARRTSTTKDNVTIYGKYEYVKGETSHKRQAQAVTRFFAVILDRKNDYTVVKPES